MLADYSELTVYFKNVTEICCQYLLNCQWLAVQSKSVVTRVGLGGLRGPFCLPSTEHFWHVGVQSGARHDALHHWTHCERSLTGNGGTPHTLQGESSSCKQTVHERNISTEYPLYLCFNDTTYDAARPVHFTRVIWLWIFSVCQTN